MYIFEITCLSVASFAIIFSHSEGCLFTLLIVSFVVQKLSSIRVFSNESVLRIRWPKYRSFSISPSNKYSGLISFSVDWFDLLPV